MNNTFEHLMLLGRPAAGKSELIDFMKNTPDDERASVYRIGKFVELDDFPWLWEKFLEDNLWEEIGYKRLYSHREGLNMGVEDENIFDLMFPRFNKEFRETYLSNNSFFNSGTLIIEFSRGKNNGYKHAFSLLSKEIFERAAILFLDVSETESKRRNNARYEEKLKHSILAHKATDRVMENYYKTHDWNKLTGGKESGYLELKGVRVPFVTMNNEPELTERGPLHDRYKPHLDKLFNLWTKK